MNAGGRRKHTVYSEKEVDFFFIVTGDHSCYLIPLSVTLGKKCLTLDSRFDEYLVSRRGGTGRHAGLRSQ